MRDELLKNFADASIALVTEGLQGLSAKSAAAFHTATESGEYLTELVYSFQVPVIVFRLVRPRDGHEIEILRIENPPTAMN